MNEQNKTAGEKSVEDGMRRADALRWAVDSSGGPANTLEKARMFDAFLQGESGVAQPASNSDSKNRGATYSAFPPKLNTTELFALAFSRLKAIEESLDTARGGMFGRGPQRVNSEKVLADIERLRTAVVSARDSIPAEVTTPPQGEQATASPLHMTKVEAEQATDGCAQATAVGAQPVASEPWHFVPCRGVGATPPGMAAIREETLVETLRMAGYGIVSPAGQALHRSAYARATEKP